MENLTSEEKYIIIDFANNRFKTDHGWTTNRQYARQFSKAELHPMLKKLRADNFLKLTFEKVEVEEEKRKKAECRIPTGVSAGAAI